MKQEPSLFGDLEVQKDLENLGSSALSLSAKTLIYNISLEIKLCREGHLLKTFINGHLRFMGRNHQVSVCAEYEYTPQSLVLNKVQFEIPSYQIKNKKVPTSIKSDLSNIKIDPALLLYLENKSLLNSDRLTLVLGDFSIELQRQVKNEKTLYTKGSKTVAEIKGENSQKNLQLYFKFGSVTARLK